MVNRKSYGGFIVYYSNLAGKILKKLPKPPNKFTLETVFQHYKGIIHCFILVTASEHTILNISKNTNVSIKAGSDNLSGRFLKDGADVVAKPTTD